MRKGLQKANSLDFARSRMAHAKHPASSLHSIQSHGDVDAVINQNVVISANAVLKVTCPGSAKCPLNVQVLRTSQAVGAKVL